jgi:hypothetical protein
MTPFLGDCAFRHLKCRRDRAIGKQSSSTALRYRIHLSARTRRPIMFDDLLNFPDSRLFALIRGQPAFDYGDYARWRVIPAIL